MPLVEFVLSEGVLDEIRLSSQLICNRHHGILDPAGKFHVPRFNLREEQPAKVVDGTVNSVEGQLGIVGTISSPYRGRDLAGFVVENKPPAVDLVDAVDAEI